MSRGIQPVTTQLPGTQRSAALLLVVFLKALCASQIQAASVGTYSLELEHETALGDSAPFNASFWYPTDGGAEAYPILVMLNGFNVESEWYSNWVGTMAGKGYVVVGLDYLQPSAVATATLDRPGCSNDTVDAVVAGLFNDVWEGWLFNASEDKPDELQEALQQADNSSAVLLAHSYGGWVAWDIIYGTCEGSAANETLQDLASPCEGYSTVVSPYTGQDVIKGVVAFEGTRDPALGPRTVPDGKFIVELSGQYSQNALDTYGNMTGPCSSYVKLSHDNHYGAVNFNPVPNSHQMSACGTGGLADPADFTTDQQTQDASIYLVANIADAAIRGKLYNDQSSITYLLHDLPTDPRIMQAHVNSTCYRALA